ncbi:MAG: DUF4097 family beta strand repeat protein [Lachnospiraceae bacterium]|nr:DUF4097 family beta strand repeat protein [Lachnospiraceae bacterium]
MKKFWKATLIPGICCILAGIVLAVVLAVGFSDELIGYQDQLSINAENFLDFFEFDRFGSGTRTGTHYSRTETKESYDFAVSDIEEVTGICFEFAVGEVRIKEGDVMEVHVRDMFEDAISSEVRDGIWYIEDALMEEGSVHSDYCPEIEVVLPEKVYFETMEIYLAAGMFSAEELRAGQVLLDVSAGSMKVMELEAEERLELINGVGEIVVYDLTAHNLTVDNGVGAISLTGAVSGDNSVECGIGEVKIILTDRSEVDFNYEIDCGIGEVEVDGKKYRGNVERVQGENTKADSFTLDCGIGRIELDIE